MAPILQWMLLGRTRNREWWLLCIYCSRDDVQEDIGIYRRNGDRMYPTVAFIPITDGELDMLCDIEKQDGFNVARVQQHAGGYRLAGEYDLLLSPGTTDILDELFAEGYSDASGVSVVDMA